jgi:hypothetical protein
MIEVDISAGLFAAGVFGGGFGRRWILRSLQVGKHRGGTDLETCSRYLEHRLKLVLIPCSFCRSVLVLCMSLPSTPPNTHI